MGRSTSATAKTRSSVLAGAAAALAAGAAAATLGSHPASAQSSSVSADTIFGAFPKGVILPWYAKSGSFPMGWAICDGSNGTPDLRHRFLIGVGNMSDVGQTTGQDSHTHGVSKIGVSVSGTTLKAQDPGSNADAWHSDGMSRGGAPQTSGLDHTHAFSGSGGTSGNTDPASHIPPSVTVLYMMRV